jgi:hypothetical protein
VTLALRVNGIVRRLADGWPDRCLPAVGRDEPKANTIFGNRIFRPETFGRIRPQKADKPAILLPQTVIGHSDALQSRRILQPGKPPPLVRTTWWRTQSSKTSLRRPKFSDNTNFCV